MIKKLEETGADEDMVCLLVVKTPTVTTDGRENAKMFHCGNY